MSVDDEEEEWRDDDIDDFLDDLPVGCDPDYYEDDDDEFEPDDDYYDPDELYDDYDYCEERKESLWNIIRRTWWKYVTRASWQFSECPQCGRLNIFGGHEDHIPF